MSTPEQKTNLMLKGLCSELRPVRCLPAAHWRALSWVLVSVVLLTLASIAVGWRTDWPTQLNVYNLALLLAACSAAYGALLLGTPCIDVPRRVYGAAMLSALLWGALLCAKSLHMGAWSTYVESFHLLGSCMCAFEILLFSALPAWLMVYFLRCAAPTHFYITAALGALAATSLAVVASRFVHASDDALHLLLWHFAPALLITLIFGLLGRKILKW